MKVLKFGGTSVGTPEALGNVKQIIASQKSDVIVVVSALGGITDNLIQASSLAEAGDCSFRDLYRRMSERHLSMVDAMFDSGEVKENLKSSVTALLSELGTLLEGVFTLKVLPEKTSLEIVSFGERLSSLIVNALIDGSVLYDSLSIIKTVKREYRTVLDADTTEKLVKEAFKDFGRNSARAIVPGFISRDAVTGDITNLGRGGSDYTASIIAAALDAESLEIWTDVDGFMTADPRVINSSYVIDQLSFSDAMELCNFGAKVIYPPALYPVCPKDIPVWIKNTFNPSARGTVIRQTVTSGGGAVTGISSINDTTLLTVSGTSMAGIVGVDSRIFKALASRGISVFFVCQSSSETNISLGVNDAVAALSADILTKEFEHEIAEGSMDPIQVHRNLATVAVVGERMKGVSGIAGKLFSVLGRNGISIIACAQGTEERNISFVVEKQFLKKSLNVIHDSFFLSIHQELNVFICGIGTVGGNLIDQISAQREKLINENNLKINVVGICRSKRSIFNRDGIDLSDYRALLENGMETTPESIRDQVIGMNIFNSVFVDCTASSEIASLYGEFFEHGISVVAANKIAASSDYKTYSSLKALARNYGVKFLFETNVGAGLPIINTINALCNSGDKVQKIEAVLSGTLNYIFNTISADIPFSETVKMAMESGFAEPDPRIDLSGKDVIRKLVILSREAGYAVEQDDVQAELFIPEEFFACSIEEFWKKLPELDCDFERRRAKLASENKRWRFVARMDSGSYSVSLCEVEKGHPFYSLDGSNNIILLTTERYHEHPMHIQGYGAGAGVTAAGVFADIMSIANV